LRALAHPKTLRSAFLAAFFSALVSLPRIVLWTERPYPVWYLEAVLFLSGIVLWAFVFAWHTKYTSQPVFTFNLNARHFAEASCAGLVLAGLLLCFIDPISRLRTPEDYPSSVCQLIAMIFFSLGFAHLFTVFAPFAWLIRLFQSEKLAAAFTISFGVVLVFVKNHSSHVPLPPNLLLSLLVLTIASGLLSIYFFLRGGVLLVWWFALLLFSRHLLHSVSSWN